MIEYFNGTNWVVGSSLTVAQNGTYLFRVTDRAGSVTEKSVVVNKIDKAAPELEIIADDTAPYAPFVNLLPQVSDSSLAKVEVSFDQKSWTICPSSGIKITENKTVFSRAVDSAGNATRRQYVVDNIGAEFAPVKLFRSETLVSCGTILAGKTLNAGERMLVSKGGAGENNAINSGASIVLSSGGIAVGNVINANGALHVYSGAAASKTTVNQSGYFGVGKGAATYDTTLGYAGKLTVWNGGKVYRNTLNQYGTLILSSGALADSSVINSQGIHFTAMSPILQVLQLGIPQEQLLPVIPFWLLPSCVDAEWLKPPIGEGIHIPSPFSFAGKQAGRGGKSPDPCRLPPNPDFPFR